MKCRTKTAKQKKAPPKGEKIMAKRVFIIVLDSFGIGEMPDAARFGDVGSNTLGAIVKSPKYHTPTLQKLGLFNIEGVVCGRRAEAPLASFARLEEVSNGKDTTTGHWEIAGLTLKEPFPTFPNGFPAELIEEFERESGMQVIGNKAASGTEIIEELGPEHLMTGKLIVYTSADSVFQIAAHEAIVPPMELWHICRIARRVCKGKYGVARVIARPFIGTPGAFERTANRRDFSVDPLGTTLLDALYGEGYDVYGVGKIEDIFNHRGITASNHASGNEECTNAVIEALKKPHWKGLLFANLVDTDMLYGHRNDPEGFARCLEAFDQRLPEILRLLGERGMLIITADHGCDPTTPGTDHTRESVPVLVWGLGLQEGVNLGVRATFADVSATILEALGAKARLDGESFYSQIRL